MNLIERAKKMILKPKDEWVLIDQETTSVAELVTSFLIPLALIPAVASLIGYGFFFKFNSLSLGIKFGVLYFVNYAGGAMITAYVIDALAQNFSSTRDFRKAMQLVVYSYTPMMVAGVVMIFPALNPLLLIAGLYSLYLLYLGIKPMMKTPDDKVATYFIVSLVVLIVVFMVISQVLTRIFIGNTFAALGGF
jgi:hypothetical protein